MTTSASGPRDEDSPSQAPDGGERLVYVVPQESGGYNPNQVSLLDLWDILWAGKWIGIALTLALATATAVYSLSMTEWYRSEVLLSPAEDRTSGGGGAVSALGGLGGLAGLAGIRVGSNNVEALAVLRSRDFAREFITDHNLMPVLLADKWDTAANDWVAKNPADRPDIRDAVKLFQDDVLDVSEEPQTGLVTVAVEWTDPVLAAEWAGLLVERLNDHMRQEALREAETNVAYLQGELASASLVTLQQSIGSLLENEMQKLMLARGNEQFAFKIIDPAVPPKQRDRPHRTLMVALAIVLGGLLSMLVIFIRYAVRKNRGAGTTEP